MFVTDSSPFIANVWRLVALAALALSGVYAQESTAPATDTQEVEELDLPRSSDPGEQPFLRGFIDTERRMWVSPLQRSTYNSRTVKRYIVPFSLIAAALIATDQRISNNLPNTNDQAVWSGRVSQIGAAYTLAGAAGAMYLIGKSRGDKKARNTGWYALEAIAHTQLLVFGMKQITNRERPVRPDASSGFWKGGDSFPSGHAATSFATAAVFAYQYRDKIAVPIIAYSIAGIVSASRISARRHWMSDIFVGGSTGFLIGRYIYMRHNPILPYTSNRSFLAKLTPEFGMSPRGPALTWNFGR